MEPRALLTLSYGVNVVGSFKGEKLNAQISNAVMQVTGTPHQVAVAINKKELTHELIAESRVFTVTVLAEDAPLSFIGRFGFNSGRDMDKFEGIEFQLARSGAPYPIDHAVSMMAFEVVKEVDVGTHTLFIGEMTQARILKSDRPMSYAYYREELKGKTPPNAPTHQEEQAEPESQSDKPGAEEQRESSDATSDGKYQCNVCGYVYDPANGDPDRDIQAGTPFEDLPDDWVCPVCGMPKSEFKEQ